MTEMEILYSDLHDIYDILEDNGYGAWCRTIRKAVDLLEERKPVTPNNVKGNFCCGRCLNPLHTAIINPMIRFCDHCGNPVNWEGVRA